MTNLVDLAHKRRIKECDQTHDSTKVTPRDILVEAIRAIDAKEIEPEKMVIVWAKLTDNISGWQTANVNKYEVLGLISEFEHYYNKGVDV